MMRHDTKFVTLVPDIAVRDRFLWARALIMMLGRSVLPRTGSSITGNSSPGQAEHRW